MTLPGGNCPGGGNGPGAVGTPAARDVGSMPGGGPPGWPCPAVPWGIIGIMGGAICGGICCC